MNLKTAIHKAGTTLLNTGYPVKNNFWQATELKQPLWEALNVTIKASIPSSRAELVKLVKPNLPWADVHHQERVGGYPLNPGESYKSWPYYGRDKDMRRNNEKFSHTYMERIWPKLAGKVEDGYTHYTPEQGVYISNNRGIRYDYGDFKDVINLLIKDPLTRQAYLPIFFPEDTGAVHGERIPCTIGYHFIMRHRYLHVIYHIRSCDYFRHLRDDIYLAILLADTLLTYLGKLDRDTWEDVKLGTFTMHIGSLHIFEVEVPKLLKELKS